MNVVSKEMTTNTLISTKVLVVSLKFVCIKL